jgi:alpha-D-ribose 1-methylphosphonate 5-triphosphate diphosphatase
MSKNVCLHGGPVFDGEHLLAQGAVVFNNEGIAVIVEGDVFPPVEDAHDVCGQLIVPGLVDLHSDSLEKWVEMRPGIYFDAAFALQSLDQRIASCGITTFCHAISFADDESGLRSPEEAEKLVRLIHHFSKLSHCSVHHKIHARFEVGSTWSLEILERLLSEKLLDLVSFMDHTPGQGQFKTLQSFIDYYRETYHLTQEEIICLVDKKQQRLAEGWVQIANLASKAHQAGIPLLSHDDDTVDKIDLVERLHVTGSEFPVSMEAAKAAKKRSMKVFMGAPNLVRGVSSNGHLRASETIKYGVCDGLMSDYYPECLVQAPFVASKILSMDLEDVLKLVTSKPATFLSKEKKRGYLVEGGPADIAVIDTSNPWIRVTQTWVNGKLVYCSGS